MFNALTSEGRAISSLDPFIHPPYYCPDCHHELQLRKTRTTRPHFVHSRNADCIQVFGESEGHTQGKALLADWLKGQNLSPIMEKQLPEEGRRADVFVQWAGNNVAIEMQRSAISSSLLLDRSRTYTGSRILPLWIFDSNLVQRKSNGRWFWNEAVWGSVFSGYFNAVPVLKWSSQELLIVQPFFETSPNRIAARASRFPLSAIKLPHFFTPMNLPFDGYREILAHKYKWRYTSRRFAGCGQYWAGLEIYTRFLSHISMHPAELGWPTPYCYVFQGPPLLWQTLLFYRVIYQKGAALKNILASVQEDPMLAPLIRPGLRSEVYMHQAVWHFLQWLKDRKAVCFHNGRWHVKKELLPEVSVETGWSKDRSFVKMFTVFLKKLETEKRFIGTTGDSSIQ
ncbi:competence protein CoiA [Marinococcus halophilus]|nr:competence protein CoiA family protein [Marinococcus halophilus]